jgi:hypothetical protein
VKTVNLTQIEEFELIPFVVDVVRSEWRIMVFAAVFAIGSLAYLLISLPPRYEALAKIHVAKVAGNDVESLATAIERINSPMFSGNGMAAACSDANGRMDKIRALAARTASYIELRYKGGSPAIAKACLIAAMAQLTAAEKPIQEGLLKGPRQKLLIFQRQLDEDLAFQKKIDVAAVNFDTGDGRFSQSALILSAYLTKRSEGEGLRRDIAELESLLQAPKTNDVALFEPIYSPETAVGMTGVVKGTTSFFGGLMIAFGIAVISWMVTRRRNAPVRERLA